MEIVFDPRTETGDEDTVSDALDSFCRDCKMWLFCFLIDFHYCVV